MERAELTALVRATGCAEEHSGGWFLTDPHWTAAERERAATIMAQAPAAGVDQGWLGIPTGGSSGEIRFARHDELTLGAAARGFCAHFNLSRINVVDVLPPFHVSGLMARVRAAATAGRHVACEWRRLAAGDRPVLEGSPWVVSLVPTQLQRLLASAGSVAWLRQFEVILLGGGPLWPELAASTAAASLPVAPSYGMTETAAMVAALRPAEFLQGARDSGTPLPHARVSVTAAGVVAVAGSSVFRGYWPEWRTEREIVTEDAGEIDARGHLHVHGRRDAVIITGGRKVQPGEVELVLRATGQFSDVAVIGVPDAEWGEAVVACYPPGGNMDWSVIQDLVRRQLPGFKRPKRYVEIADWPRTAHGKLNRARLCTAATER